MAVDGMTKAISAVQSEASAACEGWLGLSQRFFQNVVVDTDSEIFFLSCCFWESLCVTNS